MKSNPNRRARKAAPNQPTFSTADQRTDPFYEHARMLQTLQHRIEADARALGACSLNRFRTGIGEAISAVLDMSNEVCDKQARIAARINPYMSDAVQISGSVATFNPKLSPELIAKALDFADEYLRKNCLENAIEAKGGAA